MLTFTDWQGRDIGDSNPQDANSIGILDDDLIIIYPAVEIPGVDITTVPAEIAGVDPDFDVEPMGNYHASCCGNPRSGYDYRPC
jgi:hypothetical protein